jgi:hypothetical protein
LPSGFSFRDAHYTLSPACDLTGTRKEDRTAEFAENAEKNTVLLEMRKVSAPVGGKQVRRNQGAESDVSYLEKELKISLRPLRSLR